MNTTIQNSTNFRGHLTKTIYKDGQKTVEHFPTSSAADKVFKFIGENISDGFSSEISSARAKHFTDMVEEVTKKPVEGMKQNYLKKTFLFSPASSSGEIMAYYDVDDFNKPANGVHISLKV